MGRALTNYRRVMTPLVAPALVTLTNASFTFHRDGFVQPLFFLTRRDKMTLPFGLTVVKGYPGGGNPAEMMTGVTMAIAPVLPVFLLVPRSLIEGITITEPKE